MTYYKKEGYIPVDSGQIMLIDPCYIKQDFESESTDSAGLNYAGACAVTLSDNRCGVFGDLAFATSTHSGDGTYPVFVKRDRKGKILAVKIEFADEEEMDDYEE
jgi:hypothetical protein